MRLSKGDCAKEVTLHTSCRCFQSEESAMKIMKESPKNMVTPRQGTPFECAPHRQAQGSSRGR